MKKLFKILGIILLVVIASAVVFYFSVIRPIVAEEAALKPVLIAKANELLKCSFEPKKIEDCYYQRTSKAFQNAISLSQYISIINKVKEKLGNRLSFELMPGKFNLMVYKGIPSGKKVDFILNAAYQNDIFASETYVYSLVQEMNEYKLDAIRFNSNKLIE